MPHLYLAAAKRNMEILYIYEKINLSHISELVFLSVLNLYILARFNVQGLLQK